MGRQNEETTDTDVAACVPPMSRLFQLSLPSLTIVRCCPARTPPCTRLRVWLPYLFRRSGLFLSLRLKWMERYLALYTLVSRPLTNW
jgi:hypothetical protein